ncbi:MAG: protein translocase subunit SecF [Patescibacteria group bacterium]
MQFIPNNMFAVKHRKKFFIISGLMLLCAYILMLTWGFNIGTDFKGGSIVEVNYENGLPTKSDLESVLADLDIGSISVRVTGESGFIVRTRDLSLAEQELLKDKLNISGSYPYTLVRSNSVGPLIGQELTDKAILAIFAIIVITIFFIAYTFRHVSRPVSSWHYGLVSIIALVHDISIPAGVAVVLGKFYGMEIDALFITALLSLLGYSINDTIIIFDRIRENLKHNKENNLHESFEETVGKSLSQTYGRSINTSLTVFLVLISLFVFGGATIKFFILTLIIGTIAGAYSSIFLAAPLLVSINNRRK